MKELSIEQKAKAYDEAIERYKAKQEYESQKVHEFIEYLFPELKESEDEKTIKEIKQFIRSRGMSLAQSKVDSWLAWLEKQGKQKPTLDVEIPFGAKDSELQEASYYIPEGFHAEIEGNRVVIKRGEQKPTNKVEPKFKQGDIIKEKETGNLFYVNSVEEFGYTLHYKDCIEKGCVLSFKYEDNYELVEQVSAWSEKDEMNLEKAIWYVENPAPMVVKDSMLVEWLKSIKDRVQPQPKQEWKPSDEQMKALSCINVTGCISYTGQGQELINLYNDLKKLKG